MKTCRFLAAISAASLIALSQAAFAAPTDIISNFSTLRDSLARLASDGLLPIDASDLLQYRVLTRADASRLLEKGLGLTGMAAPSSVKGQDVAAVRSLLVNLREELTADGVNVDAALRTYAANATSFTGLVQPESRTELKGGQNDPGSGTVGIYRGTAVGDLDSDMQYAVSVSDQAENDRRVFWNDVGPHDFSAVTQAYIQFNGHHDLNFLVGRTDDNWGPGTEGGAMLSDNAPNQDQLRVSFPFSFGKRFGRNWEYTQLASTYKQGDKPIYLQARRIEINFNRRWSAQYEEALKSTASSLLLRSPLPFYPAKLIDSGGIANTTEFIFDTGLEYQPSPYFRGYGQLLVNDIENPFRGIGLEGGSNTPQRLGYVVGVSYQTLPGTSATVEYATANDATFLDTHPQLSWTEGTYDYLGFPQGSNFKQVLGVFSQRITSKVTLAIEGRDRFRYDDSYPAPDVRDFAGSAKYQFDRRNSFSLTYHDYSQEAYAYAPGSPNYPSGNGFEPTSEANPGTATTIKELDAAYTFVF